MPRHLSCSIAAAESGVQPPHSWKKYWKVLMDAQFGAHIVVGMGTTEVDLPVVQRLVDLGGHSHMFCLFPREKDR